MPQHAAAAPNAASNSATPNGNSSKSLRSIFGPDVAPVVAK